MSDILSTVLDKMDAWPTDWTYQLFGSMMREEVRRPIAMVLRPKRDEWMREHCDPPTELRVGIDRQREFLDQLRADSRSYHTADLLPVVYGMKIIWVEGGKIELFGSTDR